MEAVPAKASAPFSWKVLIAATTAGAVAGLSAPGIEQWYLAWFGFAPLLILIGSSANVVHAGVRAFFFGLGFNLVYLNWYLGLHPLSWLGFADWQSIGISVFCLLFVTCQQALIYGLFGFLMRLIPLCGGFLPRQVDGRWCAPAFLVVPLLWCVIQEKVGNAPDLLGVPWSMIEYTQYKQIALIQVCSIVGGIGFAALMMLSNTCVATLITSFQKKSNAKSLIASSRSNAVAFICVPALLAVLSLAYGYARLAGGRAPADQTISIVQGNVNIEMQKTNHRYTLAELADHYRKLIVTAPPGFCVMTESALPTYLKESPSVLSEFRAIARQRHLDMIIGSIDREDASSFNSAFGITRFGELLPQVYHKRYLVPVGEYKPAFLNYLPEFLQRLTDTPAGTGFTAGRKPAVLVFDGKVIAPLICFETISPELMASSVRNGGMVLVNMSDLAWFHGSMIGDQAAAIAAFRAVESDRFFVYAANTGPSMIIDPFGKIVSRGEDGHAALISGKVGLRSTRSPFVEWFN